MGYVENLLLFSPEKLSERIQKKVPLKDVLRKFPENEAIQMANAIEALITQKGVSLELGGGTVREALGCTRDQINGVSSLVHGMFIHDQLRLGDRILKILSEYPDERMKKPDLDFFITINGGTEERLATEFVADCLGRNGIGVDEFVASGGVRVMDTKTQGAVATFTDSADSWQTKEYWPMYGFRAPVLMAENGPLVNIDIAWNRMFLYPLQMPGFEMIDINEPSRYAAVARAVLWAAFAKDPNGKDLRVPMRQYFPPIMDTVDQTDCILTGIEKGNIDPRQYRGSLRDITLASTEIIPNYHHYSYIDPERYQYFGELAGRLQSVK